MFKISYKTTLPKIANSPLVTISRGDGLLYTVNFYEIVNDQKVLLGSGECLDGNSYNFQYTQTFVNWYISISLGGNIVYDEYFDPSGKPIFIKMDAHALGDNIAWIPYVEVFRKKWNCTVICSTFYNDIFRDNYPNILFVNPNTNVDNVYAQYYIGANSDGDFRYSKIKSDENPLQFVASSILGLDDLEIRPNLTSGLIKPYQDKYVCLSEWGSSELKMWKCPGGWQRVVDYINSKGYKVVVISKEKTNLNNVVDLTGNFPLRERMNVLYGSSLFLGVSSGLSWLAWGIGIPVVMVSDVTPIDHEFSCLRVSCNKELKKVDYSKDNWSDYSDFLKELEKVI